MFVEEAGAQPAATGVAADPPTPEPATTRTLDRLVSGVFWHGAATCVVLVFGFVTSIYLNRSLGKSGYGTLVLALAIPNILSAVTHLGSRTGLARFLPHAMQHQDRTRAVAVIAASWRMHVAGIIGFGAVWWLSLPWLANEFYGRPDLLKIFQLTVWYVAGVSLSEFFVLTFQSLQWWKRASALELLHPALYLLGAWYAIGRGGSVSGVVAANVAASLIVGVFGSLWLWRAFRPAPSSAMPATSPGGAPERGAQAPQDIRVSAAMGELWRFGAPMLVSYLGLYLFQWLDKAVLGKFIDAGELSLYAVAFMFMNLLMTGFKVFYNVLMPYAAGLRVDDEAGLRRTFHMIFRWFLHGAIAAALVAAHVAEPVLAICYGPSYRPAAVFVQGLMVFFLLRVSTNPTGMFIVNVFNLTRVSAAISLIVTACDVALMWWWAPRWGVWGAIAAAVAAYGVYWVLTPLWVPRMRRLLPWRSIFVMGVALSAACAVSVLSWTWWQGAVVSVSVYAAVNVVLAELTMRDLDLVRDIVSRGRRWMARAASGVAVASSGRRG